MLLTNVPPGTLAFLLELGGWFPWSTDGGKRRESPCSDASAVHVRSVTMDRAMTLGQQEQGPKPGFWAPWLCDAGCVNSPEPEKVNI